MIVLLLLWRFRIINYYKYHQFLLLEYNMHFLFAQDNQDKIALVSLEINKVQLYKLKQLLVTSWIQIPWTQHNPQYKLLNF